MKSILIFALGCVLLQTTSCSSAKNSTSSNTETEDRDIPGMPSENPAAAPVSPTKSPGSGNKNQDVNQIKYDR